MESKTSLRESTSSIHLIVFLFTSNSIKVLETLCACWLTDTTDENLLFVPFLVSWDFILTKNIQGLGTLIQNAIQQLEQVYQKTSTIIQTKFRPYLAATRAARQSTTVS